jgi:hypothetical protein
MKIKNEQFTQVLVAGLFLIPHSKGDFYLDPGSGSFILQVLIAAGAGAVYMLRTQLSSLFSFGKKKPAAKKSPAKKTSKARSKKRNAS